MIVEIEAMFRTHDGTPVLLYGFRVENGLFGHSQRLTMWRWEPRGWVSVFRRVDQRPG